MRSYLASLSIFINAITGGRGRRRYARIALRREVRCLFCELVSSVLWEPNHCQSEMGWWAWKR